MHVFAVAPRNREFLVVVLQRLFAYRRDFARHQRIAHGRAGAVGGNRRLRGAVMDLAVDLIAKLEHVAVVRKTEAQLPEVE